MEKTLLFAGILVLMLACTPKKSTEMKQPSTTYSFLVGTYTDDFNQGISQLDFSPQENKLALRTIFSGIQNPSFVIANKKRNQVFSLEEIDTVPGGNIVSFDRSDSIGLVKISEMPSFGDHPCYLALSPNEQFITVANYSGGSLSVYKVNSDATLAFLQTIQHEGSSINKERQESAHVHSTVFSADGKYLLVCDLGSDQIYVYDFDEKADKPLSLNNTFKVMPGGGPRHLIFSSDGKEIFVVEELTAVLDIFSFEKGVITPKQRIPLVDEGFEGEVGAAEVRISPDEQHLYVSNRGDANTLSVIGKNENGEYALVQQLPSGGKTPRNFNLTADGKYLLAAHQGSNTITVFERDLTSGKLTPTSWKVEVHKPVYLFRL